MHSSQRKALAVPVYNNKMIVALCWRHYAIYNMQFAVTGMHEEPHPKFGIDLFFDE